MIPKRVSLKNFLSFGEEEQTLDFTENESLWILTGPNGVGKSAVFDAITYCLFAEHRGGKSDAKSLIRHGANALRVTFEFEFDGIDYRITRTRGSNATQKVESKTDGEWKPIAGVNGVAELAAWVRDTLGLAYEAFTKSVLLRQGESDAIILAKGTERLEMLKKIIDVERFEKLSLRIADATREHQNALKVLQQRRDNAKEITPEETAEAEAALAAAELERDAAQSAVLGASKAVEQAKQFAKLDAERQELDAKLRDADDRAKQKQQIETDHARLATLTAVLPPMKGIAAARSRIASAEEKRGTDSAALAKLNDEFTADANALEMAREKAKSHQAAKDEHEREKKRLEGEIDREAKYLSTAENVARLAEQLKESPPELDAKREAAREAVETSEETMLAATTARADADSRLKQIRKKQQEFKSLGAKCSTCGQSVSEKYAADEKAKLDAEAAAAAKQFAEADLALAKSRSEKLSTKEEFDSLSEAVKKRDEAKSSFDVQKQMLDAIQVQSDPAELKKSLDAKRAAAKQHVTSALGETRMAAGCVEEAKRLEGKVKQATGERDALAGRIQVLDRSLAGDISARDTLLGQLAPEWHSGVDVDLLAAEQAKLAASGIAARFAALASDSENQHKWKARRDSIRDELAELPATSLKDAEVAAADATKHAAEANAARDSAKSQLDALVKAVEAFLELKKEVAATEVTFERHRKLNAWLGKEGLLRELVREAEREIVHHAQDTLRTLSSGDLEIELQGPSDGKDEALVLLVRRAGDPEPIPVRFLSGSQKFRVAVAIAVAIGKFAAGPAAAKPLESVIIDEGFGSLDKDGLAAMREELENLKNSQALKRVILVSHQEEFTKSFAVGYTLSPGEQGTIATRFRNDG